ncbi:MAG: pirin family protein [Devosia sp.]
MSWRPSPDPTPGDAASVDAVDLLIVPRAVDLGEMVVRRALPSVWRQMVGPFIFIDQMGPAEFLTDQDIDVRPHSHINLSTFTYLFKGQIWHRDSLGSDLSIEPGAVNWMSAGRGIVHSERTSDEQRRNGQKLFGIQTWMAMPEKLEENDPDFAHYGKTELPLINLGGGSARMIAGTAFGATSPIAAPSETLFADIQLSAGTRIPIEPTVVERALYTIDGEIEVTGKRYTPGHLLILRLGEQIIVEATTDARLMLFGGEPMEGPCWIWWNLVSSRLERIEQAKEEWRRGQFQTVPGDEAEFIPLPEEIGTPRRAVGGQSFGEPT